MPVEDWFKITVRLVTGSEYSVFNTLPQAEQHRSAIGDSRSRATHKCQYDLTGYVILSDPFIPAPGGMVVKKTVRIFDCKQVESVTLTEEPKFVFTMKPTEAQLQELASRPMLAATDL